MCQYACYCPSVHFFQTNPAGSGHARWLWGGGPCSASVFWKQCLMTTWSSSWTFPMPSTALTYMLKSIELLMQIRCKSISTVLRSLHYYVTRGPTAKRSVQSSTILQYHSPAAGIDRLSSPLRIHRRRHPWRLSGDSRKGRPESRQLTDDAYEWVGHAKYDDPRLNMSHSGCALVWHL